VLVLDEAGPADLWDVVFPSARDARGDLVGLAGPGAGGAARDDVAVTVDGAGRGRGEVAVLHGQPHHRAEAFEVGVHAGGPAGFAGAPAVVEAEVGPGAGRRSPQASAGIPANTRESARSGKKKPQPRTVGV